MRCKILFLLLLLTLAGCAPANFPQPEPHPANEQYAAPSPPQTRVHFIDVGQADCTYIQIPGHIDVLIDGGNAEDGPRIVEYLNAQGVDDLELVIATHPHEDHIGGLNAVFEAFAVEEVIDSGKKINSRLYQQYSSLVGREGCRWEQDDHQAFTWSCATLQILTGRESWPDLNDYSVVARLSCGQVVFLFAGDAENPAEKALTGDIKASVLKVGHHGSSSSSSAGFLHRVNPDLAIVSVGADNPYGHPAASTLKRLRAGGAQIYRTDLNGSVLATTDGFAYTTSFSQTTDTP